MLKGNKGPIIQVDRLIFDTRFNIKPSPVIPSKSSLLLQLKYKKKKNFHLEPSPSPSLNKTNKEEINQESHIFIPSDKIKIIRLTLEDLNKDEKKIYSINQPSPSVRQI